MSGCSAPQEPGNAPAKQSLKTTSVRTAAMRPWKRHGSRGDHPITSAALRKSALGTSAHSSRTTSSASSGSSSASGPKPCSGASRRVTHASRFPTVALMYPNSRLAMLPPVCAQAPTTPVALSIL